MVNTVAGCGLRNDDRAAAIYKVPVRIFLPYPVRGGIQVHLYDDAQAALLRQTENEIQIGEVVLSRARFRCCPVHPGLDRVETIRLDLIQVLAPALGAAAIDALQHGSPHFAASIPHRRRIERVIRAGSPSNPGGVRHSRLHRQQNEQNRTQNPERIHHLPSIARSHVGRC